MSEPYGKPEESGMPVWIQMLLWIFGILVVVGVGTFAIVRLVGMEKPFEPSAEQKACIVSRQALEEYFDFDAGEGEETWTGTRFLGLVWQVDYSYVSDDEGCLITNATIEGLTGNELKEVYDEYLSPENLGVGDGVEIEEESVPFSWGKESTFRWQLSDGERYGFVYAAISKDKLYFLDIWGVELDDAQEITDLLQPFLERFHRLE